MRSRSVLILLALLALPSFALEPASSSPDNFVSLGSVALFSADDGITGRELWRSDGTADGTWQVADLCQPDCSGDPRSFAVTSRVYFFLAADGGTILHLWATDGTPGGTVQLNDDSLLVMDFRVRVGDVLYFVAVDDAHGEELWRSDGTPAGTYIVDDIRPGPEGSSPRSLTAFKGGVYFAADDGRGGALWRSDGTAAGTVMVKDPVPQFPTNAYPEALRVVGSRLVFLAPTPKQAATLWSSDGTAQGTEPFRGVFPAGFTMFMDFSVQGSRLYFVAEDTDKGQELWVTEGTAQGTRRLTSLPRTKAFFGPYHYLPLPRTSLGNRFVFGAFDAQHGAEPWITDGTARGTRLLKDLCPGSCESLITTTVWESTLPGRLFLTANDGAHGQELWVTDGSAAGTRLVRDICRGRCDSYPSFPFRLGEHLVFAASNGFGRELWRTDGTASGTVRISNFPESPWGVLEGVVAGGQLFFLGVGPEGRELWRTDGTAAGTRLVRDINQTGSN